MASARDAFLTKRALLPSRPPRFEKGSTFQPLECQFQVPDSISCDSHEAESDLGAMRPASGVLRVYSPIAADQRQSKAINWRWSRSSVDLARSEEHTSELQSLMRI